MATLEIPLNSNRQSYQFSIDLDGVTYNMKVKYVERVDLWFMDILDVSENPIVTGMPIQTNVDILAQITSEEKPQGSFIAIDETGNNRDASVDTLGNDIKLIYEEASD